ncbi:MAG: hypothetical protein KAX49_13715 [Halanaerobiales bacterium]|nr:hypothetical protein [Halanaerobiales bacterium]
MAAPYIYEPFIFSQSVNASTWIISHKFGRRVNYQIFDNNNNDIDADYIYVDDNSFQLKFYEKGVLVNKTGKVIVS